jgi:hypothetical protein
LSESIAAVARDRWVVDLRGPKAALDPQRAYAAVWEEERDETGALTATAVVFLTNRECPFRCVMCDLWVTRSTRRCETITRQIRDALRRCSARQIATTPQLLRPAGTVTITRRSPPPLGRSRDCRVDRSARRRRGVPALRDLVMAG